MSTVEFELELKNTNQNSEQRCDPQWDPKAYRCHIAVIREEDGAFSAVVLNLPGCGSCGDTEEEAIENVREAILGVIESHDAAGEAIPWITSESSCIPDSAKQKWILVNA